MDIFSSNGTSRCRKTHPWAEERLSRLLRGRWRAPPCWTWLAWQSPAPLFLHPVHLAHPVLLVHLAHLVHLALPWQAHCAARPCWRCAPPSRPRLLPWNSCKVNNQDKPTPVTANFARLLRPYCEHFARPFFQSYFFLEFWVIFELIWLWSCFGMPSKSFVVANVLFLVLLCKDEKDGDSPPIRPLPPYPVWQLGKADFGTEPQKSYTSLLLGKKQKQVLGKKNDVLFYFCFFETSFEPQYLLGSCVSTKMEHEAQIVNEAVVVVVVFVIVVVVAVFSPCRLCGEGWTWLLSTNLLHNFCLCLQLYGDQEKSGEYGLMFFLWDEVKETMLASKMDV